ncbi:MAG: hypothetical protein ABFD92_01460 [Planctomycetaceae bacterium]|nr:hypothetical protein [Planctomycetaceae bacterium]
MKHVKLETVSLKNHSELNEAWIQKVIADDPAILGLGDLVLRDKERPQPRAGRLDLLLQDSDDKRYEVEIQLGATDETHIIGTIEYWDIERNRYPQYEHCAVIVAEDITSRFLNVINLFNGTIPLVALQMTAIKADGGIGLNFTKVLDERSLGVVDEDEDIVVTDRAYWEKRTPKTIMELADRILGIVNETDPAFNFKYNKFYIGMAKGGITNNFIWCELNKSHLRLNVRLPKDESLSGQLDEAGLDLMSYKWGALRIRLKPEDLPKHVGLIKMVLDKAYSISQ